MRDVTPEYRAALRDQHKRILLVEFPIGSSTYRLNKGDTEVTYNGNVYSPTYLKEVGDIEMTSEPKINEVDVVIDVIDGIFAGLILAENWMNRKLTVTSLLIDKNGAVAGADVAFIGLLSEYSLDETSRELTLSVSSAWKDFEKTAGIRSNTASQQRFYSDDTALDHSASATKDVYWGKVNPDANTPSSSGGTTIKWIGGITVSV